MDGLRGRTSNSLNSRTTSGFASASTSQLTWSIAKVRLRPHGAPIDNPTQRGDDVTMSLRSQKVFVWWSIVFIAIYAFNLLILLHMLPPPSARWSSTEIARFYFEHATEIKFGATVASWTGACMVPLVVVITAQIYRHEHARAPVWTMLGFAGGILMTIFVALPPLCFGAAAFTPDRSADVTAAVHELGVLSLVTTDQYFIFLQVAVAVICLTPKSVVHTPFPRWFGYFTAWVLLMSEAGAIAFLTRSGPFAWNGLLAFWSPTVLFGSWLVIASVLLITAINAQMSEEDSQTPAVSTA